MKRIGRIVRGWPNGAYLIWDQANKKAFPLYGSAPKRFQHLQFVHFETDEAGRIATSAEKYDRKERRRARKGT